MRTADLKVDRARVHVPIDAAPSSPAPRSPTTGRCPRATSLAGIGEDGVVRWTPEPRYDGDRRDGPPGPIASGADHRTADAHVLRVLAVTQGTRTGTGPLSPDLISGRPVVPPAH